MYIPNQIKLSVILDAQSTPNFIWDTQPEHTIRTATPNFIWDTQPILYNTAIGSNASTGYYSTAIGSNVVSACQPTAIGNGVVSVCQPTAIGSGAAEHYSTTIGSNALHSTAIYRKDVYDYISGQNFITLEDHGNPEINFKFMMKLIRDRDVNFIDTRKVRFQYDELQKILAAARVHDNIFGITFESGPLITISIMKQCCDNLRNRNKRLFLILHRRPETSVSMLPKCLVIYIANNFL